MRPYPLPVYGQDVGILAVRGLCAVPVSWNLAGDAI